MQLKACADKVLKVRSKPQVQTFPGPQIVPPGQSAFDVLTAPALPIAQLVTFAYRVLLICWHRWSYTTALLERLCSAFCGCWASRGRSTQGLGGAACRSPCCGCQAAASAVLWARCSGLMTLS